MTNQEKKQIQEVLKKAFEKETEYVIELSDDELKIVTESELIELEKKALEFDGFEGWTVRGKLINNQSKKL